MTEMTPGQARTQKAIQARKRNAEERRARWLRDRGWLCFPPELRAPGDGEAPGR